MGIKEKNNRNFLLRQDIQKYRSLFPLVYAAIQLRHNPLRGDTIQYIYTDSKHNNPLWDDTNREPEVYSAVR
jgi:hypothetical protein